MSAFKGLYIKELKISMTFFFINLGFINLLTIASLGLKEYFDEPMIPGVLFFVLLILHTFYLPSILLTSLQVEAQSQLWLHTPTSGVRLFLAKMVAGLTYYVVSLIVSILLAKLATSGIAYSDKYAPFKELLEANLMVLSGVITVTSIYFGVWVLFYWALYHSMKGIPFVKNIRWLVILGVWILFTVLGDFISKIPTIQVFQEKGSININIFNRTSVSTDMANVQLTTIGIYVLITIAVFLASVWLLQRKVEV